MKEEVMGTFLVSHEKIDTSLKNAVAYKVLYNSTDLNGVKTQSTGLVIAPSAPGENRKVMSWAHGTTGMGDASSPSMLPDPARELTLYFASGSTTPIDYGVPGAQAFIDEGWIIASSDHQGMGTPGIHQYTINITNALDTVNIVRALKEMDLGAGDKFGIVGWSQGGGTAAAAAELDQEALGGLELVGAVAMAPGVPSISVTVPETQAMLAGSTPRPPDTHLCMILGAMVAAFPDTLSLDDVFTPLGKQIFNENWNTASVHHLGDILTRAYKHQGPILDVKKDRLPVWMECFVKASAAQRKPTSPVLVLIDGQDPDGPCPLPWQLGYIEAIKKLGGDISSTTYPNDYHFSLPQASIDEAKTWLNSKF